MGTAIDPASDRRLAAALDAARAASRAIAAVGDPQALTPGSVVEKGAAGPATVADLASQAAIVIALRRSLGEGVEIVAEENLEEAESLGGAALVARAHSAFAASGIDAGEASFRDALASCAGEGGVSAFWTVDPLDGTKGYLRGGQFAVAIALVERGRPVLGVLAAPRLGVDGSGPGDGILAVAIDGLGAVQSPLASWSPRPLRAHPWSPGDAVRVAGSVEKAHSSSDSLEARAAALGPVDPVRIDSQAKYALVARGDADCYVRLSPSAGYRECIWDHAAGAVIARESGAVVTDAAGRALDFSCGRRFRDSSGIVCATPRLHESLVRLLAGAGSAE
jgi:3'(2'), 5'-bisphosphate nucleotidase